MSTIGNCKKCGKKRVSLPARGLCSVCYRAERDAEKAAEMPVDEVLVEEVIDAGLVAVVEDSSPSLDDLKEGRAELPPGKIQVGGHHYVDLDIQPWDAMESWLSKEEFEGFLRGNAIKYLARLKMKGGIVDVRKAHHYLGKLIEVMEVSPCTSAAITAKVKDDARLNLSGARRS